MNLIDRIILEWSYRTKKGYPDLNNEEDLRVFESLFDINLKERVDTTLSAAITELPPALAFNDGFRPNSVEDFKNFLKNHSLNSKAFVNNSNKQAASNYFGRIENELDEKMVEEKFKNAIGVTNWIYSLDKKNPIDYVVWGYREKPSGIPEGHAGDIFIFHKDGSKVGVSLKAGGEKTSEPLLNSYVSTQLRAMGKEEYIDKLYTEMWNKLYSKIPGVKEIEGITSTNYYQKSHRKAVNDLFIDFHLSNESQSNEMYKEMLNINRSLVTEAINKLSVEEFKNWITNNFNLQKDDLEVPLILVKAVGDTAVQKGDPLALAIGAVNNFNAYVNNDSVQEFIINIKGAEELNLKMTIRSDKSVKPGRPPSNTGRLGMMGMLKFQYSGIKK